jgi:hypothetical protein
LTWFVLFYTVVCDVVQCGATVHRFRDVYLFDSNAIPFCNSVRNFSSVCRESIRWRLRLTKKRP